MVRGSKLLILDEGVFWPSLYQVRSHLIPLGSYVCYRWASVTLSAHLIEVDVHPIKDYKTDGVIQQSLRHEVGKDVTIVTVAHRLQTIMDADKIVRIPGIFPFILNLTLHQLVLDAGKLVSKMLVSPVLIDWEFVQVEYDSPAALLAKENGMFKSMVDGSGDREHLYAMVHRAEPKWRVVNNVRVIT